MNIFTQGKKEKELNKVVAVHIGYIKPNPYQPRKSFSQKELSALAKSISTRDVTLTPYIVVGVIYLILTAVITKLLNRAEKKVYYEE